MGRTKKPWTDESVLKAVERFYLETGMYPTTHDFQFTAYLPDPDTVRRLYGGIPAFRRKFAFDIDDYTKGSTRSELNRKLNDRAKLDEDVIEKILIQHFGEVCVHKEREFAYRSRVDFQVYHSKGIFGVDTFYPKNRAGMINIFNIKFLKYKKFTLGPVYLVCMNSNINQLVIDDYLIKRKNEREANIKLVSKETFVMEVDNFKRRVQI